MLDAPKIMDQVVGPISAQAESQKDWSLRKQGYFEIKKGWHEIFDISMNSFKILRFCMNYQK